MVKFLGQHMADVHEHLNILKPKLNMLRYGCEIEIGWHEEEQRTAFLTHLGDIGLDNTIIAKHDGTIDSRYPCELVTKPLDVDEMMSVLNLLGTAIEKFSKKGLRTQNCGIHFHVSKGPTNDNTIWRAVNAICVDESVRSNTTHAEIAERPHPTKALISQFWSLFCLRDATKHSRRLGYRSFASFLETEKSNDSHQRAVIIGRSTPTYEFRIFRTTRSKRVLVSYFEGLLALIAFCGTEANKYCTPIPEKEKAITLEELSPYPDSWVLHTERNSGDTQVFNRENGEIICNFNETPHESFYDDELVISFPNCSFLREHRILPPMFSVNGNLPSRNATLQREKFIAKILQTKNIVNPSTWKDVFPLAKFMEFVQTEKKNFPTLANRLMLTKFTDLFLEPEEFDRNRPHLEFRSGCLVYDEISQVHINLTKITHADDPLKSTAIGIVAENGPNKIKKGMNYSSNLSHLTHSCPGALESGGEQ